MINATSNRWPLVHRIGYYLLAVIIAYLLAVTSATHSVVSSLAGMGVTIGLSDRIIMAVQDIRGMAPAFLPMIAAAYLVAFGVVAMLCRWWPQWRTPLYLLAGVLGVQPRLVQKGRQ